MKPYPESETPAYQVNEPDVAYTLTPKAPPTSAEMALAERAAGDDRTGNFISEAEFLTQFNQLWPK